MPAKEILELRMSDALPPPGARMTPGHKRAILDALDQELATREEVKSLYQLSEEELLEWERNYLIFGAGGLRVTRTSQQRRQIRALQ